MQQLLLIIEQLLPRLGRILGIRALDNGIYGAGLLAEAAVDAFCHVYVVARRAPRAVLALLGLDRDGLRWADGFAEFARDAAFFACWVATEGVFAAEAGGDRALFEGVVYCVAGGASMLALCFRLYGGVGFFGVVCNLRRSEVLLQHYVHSPHHFRQKEIVARLVQSAVLPFMVACGRRHAEVLWRRALSRCRQCSAGAESYCALRGGDDGGFVGEGARAAHQGA